jgi:hypothetical protein
LERGGVVVDAPLFVYVFDVLWEGAASIATRPVLAICLGMWGREP